MAATTGHSIAHFTDLSTRKYFCSESSVVRRSKFANVTSKRYILCSLSMNGCNGGDPRAPIGTIETRTFPAVSTPALAMERLNSAVANLQSNPPSASSGIIRLEVPIQEHIEALDWLRSQGVKLLPRCYFSGRSQVTISNFSSSDLTNANGNANGHLLQHISASADDNKLVSVAGVGSAVLFRNPDPFSFDDWLAIKRFLSKNCPLIRAYGAIRFDARPNISPEWKAFGSFYFVVPQVEFDELQGSSMIAATVAWDNAFSLTYQKAIASLQTTMKQVSVVISKLRQDVSRTSVASCANIPHRKSWDLTLNRVLEEISNQDSPLTKVVLARRSQVMTTTDIDPLAWLGSFKAEGKDAYQFCLQPHESPAFIGNTPEQLFGRDQLSVFSEALAATRARGGSESLDLQMAHDLFSSSKDHHEFAIVRENIRQKLEAICSSVVTEPMKSVRKLKRVQHLYARFAGRLLSEDDEFKILSSLHPTPAVCGSPMEDARQFIAENEMFDRGLYAGPVGFFGGAQSDFAVGIRSALIGNDVGALIYAGLGVVEGSDPALEWQELELKASQFMKLMKLQAPALTTKV